MLRPARLAPVLLALALCAAPPAAAQDPTAPVGVLADAVFVDRDGTLRAEGDVTVRQGGTVLRTDLIIYDRATDTITVPGPLEIVSEADDTVLLADFAELDGVLQAGILAGARALVDGELQVAAASAERLGDRYTVLNRVTASSCRICETGDRPIWQIRASRAVRDGQEQRLHYENATLSVLGLPILYLPYFSHPDAGVNRASGVLTPEFITTTRIGPSVKIPYFQVLGPSRDLTLTPFVTTNSGIVLEAEYRQRFDRGGLTLNGAISEGDAGNSFRGFARAQGSWIFESGVQGNFDITGITDERFQSDFGYGTPDRIQSSISLRYSERDRYWEARTIYFDSLRATEDQSEVPFVLPAAEYRQTFSLGEMQAELAGSVLSFTREAGRDVTRISGGAAIERTRVLEAGLLLRGFAETTLDGYMTRDDPDFGSDMQARARSQIGLELRYPFIARGARTQIVEPIVQLVHAVDTGNQGRIANEDSQLVEFDETSLFSTNRFPGADRYETGTYANVGLRYESRTRGGRLFSGTLGRVFRTEPLGQFDATNPLAGSESDYVLSARYRGTGGLAVSGSILASDTLEIGRNEVAVGYSGRALALSATYAFLEATEVEPDRAQLIVAGAYEWERNWSTRFDFRRDLEEERFVSAGGGLDWQNECIRIAFSVSRNFAESSNTSDETSYGLNIELVGVGTGGTARRHRERCEAISGS